MIKNIYFGTVVLFALLAGPLCGQPEMEQWGNLRGIRVDGHLFRFETSLHIQREDGSEAAHTEHYINPSKFTREGTAQVVRVTLAGVEAVETVKADGVGKADLSVSLTPAPNAQLSGNLLIKLPRGEFDQAVIACNAASGEAVEFPAKDRLGRYKPLSVSAVAIKINGASTTFQIATAQPLNVDFPVDPKDAGIVMIRIRLLGSKQTAASAHTLTLSVAGKIDQTPVTISLDTNRPGRAFDGVGGNFRLQFPEADPAVIDYNLEHIRVSWARLAMWWRDWDNDERDRPLGAAHAGKVTERQKRQLEMAQRLVGLGVPVIVSVWDPPEWAILGGPREPGMYTDTVSPAKSGRVTESIADFLLYAKQQYGVEAAMFSFNEPDLGLVPTPEQHVALIRDLGRAFESRGLATKLLVADTSNATPKSLHYAQAVFADVGARGYCGAVAFHSWGGCEDENLVAWNEMAQRFGLPLLVTEAGPDAEAHRHPDLFTEPSYAFDELELYLRICALAQPTTIMEWQLTADYSLLTGGGTYDRSGPLQPTLRYWNYSQIGRTPKGAFAIPATTHSSDIFVAAFADVAAKKYIIHVLNRDAARPITLTGLPAGLVQLERVTTDAERGQRVEDPVLVRHGEATFQAESVSFTTITGETAP